jgi:predicted RecA/RadA family phage recombinase
MRNFVQSGNVISVIAPYSLVSGQGVKVGALFGISPANYALGEQVDVIRQGVYDLSAASADVGNPGDKIYWDDTNRRLTTTATGNMLVGFLTAAKINGTLTARAFLDGVAR